MDIRGSGLAQTGGGDALNPVDNPFSPGAGTRPPELVGRDDVLNDGNVLLERLRARRAERSILLTGLRGVGKTVLLNEIEHRARDDGHKTLFLEASEGASLAGLLAPQVRRLLFDLDRLGGAGNAVRRALGVLVSFIRSVHVEVGGATFGVDIEPERGSADSGILEEDLTDLFVALANAAAERKTVVVLLIDEMQYFGAKELGAIIRATHRIQQLNLPFALVGAGLPVLPGLTGDARSYAERLFKFPIIGALSRQESHRAIAEPIQDSNESIDGPALDEIFARTQGYPYFLQEWGYQVWNSADRSPITLQDVIRATERVTRRLDENFFRVRFDRLTPNEKRMLRAMAELGPGPHRTGDVARMLGHDTSTKISQVRRHLIDKGMIYSPTHGELAFTVPLFDEFMKRAMHRLDEAS